MQVRRLKEFGVTKGELNRYMDALLKDSEHLAAMIDNVSSVDNLEFIMESDALGHTVMDQRQGHESLFAVAGTVTLEEVIFTHSDPNYYCLLCHTSNMSVLIIQEATTSFIVIRAYIFLLTLTVIFYPCIFSACSLKLL